MMGFTFRGTHINTFPGLIVKTVNNPMLAARKINRVDIPCRDGSFAFEDGFENKTLEFACTITKGSLQQRRAQAREIAAWLSGTGDLIIDYEQGKIYKVIRTVSDVSLTVNKMKDDFHITFETEPFQYGSLQTISIDNPASFVITNNGTAKANTIISVSGIGNVTVSCGNEAFSLIGITEKINLDSSKMLVYADTLQNRMQNHSGGFIRLAPGANAITVVGTVSNLSVQFYDTYL